jgi:hypothetical protein
LVIALAMSKETRYPVKCSCGEDIRVLPSAAGSVVKCCCGNQVRVPRLSELRSAVGDTRFRFSAIETLRHQLAAGVLPTSNRCAHCQLETTHIMEFGLECYIPSAGSGGEIWWLAPLDGFGMLFGKGRISQLIATYEAANPQLVRHASWTVPLRVAAACQPLIREMTDPQLRALMATEPLYARLFAESPLVRTFLIPDESTRE